MQIMPANGSMDRAYKADRFRACVKSSTGKQKNHEHVTMPRYWILPGGRHQFNMNDVFPS